MTQAKCPCEECISLAICYQLETIYCRDLYESICDINDCLDSYTKFNGYKRGVGNTLFNIYNRYVLKTSYVKYSITFTKIRDHSRSMTLYDSRQVPV